MTTIILTTEDAEKFKMFQKHYDLFTQLEVNDVFNMQFGKVIMSFAYGELQNIIKEECVYSIKYPKKT